MRFWRRYATRHYRSYLWGFVFLGLTTALTVAIPTFIEYAVDAIQDEDPSEASTFAWALLFAGLGVMVVRTLSRILFFNPGREIEFDLKSDMFGHLTQMPKRYYDQVRPGEIISRGTNDASMVRVLVGFGSLQFFNVIFLIVFTIGKMIHSNPLLTLYCVVPLIIATLILRRIIRGMFVLVRRSQEQLATLSGRILESYNGAAVLQTFNATKGAQARFDEANDEMLAIGMGLVRIRAWLMPIVRVVGNACLIIVLYVGGSMVVNEAGLTGGELAAFVVYIRIVVGALTGMGWLLNVLQRGWISLTRVYDVLDAPTRRTDADTPLPSPEPGGGHALSVRDLTFSYPDDAAESTAAASPALQNISFDVAAGETVGIFGLTGSGKSTLLHLLARTYEPPEGTVSVDGVDIRSVRLTDYWRAMAYVPQDPFLFSQTIRENIALSASADDIDTDAARERAEAAADAAQLSGDLASLPEGLDTTVGERGITLSGGQRQRAALARAFYRDFDLLLLDDVLSAVDHATEKRLIDAIYARAQGGTTLVVSHRISVLRRAHRIIVLDGGKLVATGTHASLVANDVEPYAKTWRLQQARAQIEAETTAPVTESAGDSHV
ncbi:MAG: ATP-binding cassette subfamily B multidrug efflux pump [Myxococcota bacterium]|jgi:ATP-binding cassette subfamily B multidrug efflux pump